MFCKFFFALIIFHIKPISFKMHLHSWQGQSGFNFLVIILNDEREEQFFIFWGTIAQNFGVKKNIVSVPYLTVFGFLLYSSWRFLKLYVGDLLSFVMSPIIIAGEVVKKFIYFNSWTYFYDGLKKSHLFQEGYWMMLLVLFHGNSKFYYSKFWRVTSILKSNNWIWFDKRFYYNPTFF